MRTLIRILHQNLLPPQTPQLVSETHELFEEFLADFFFFYLQESSTLSNTSTQSEPTKTPDPTISPPPEKPVNKAGVAAGVVVGVLAIAGIGIGLFLLTKKRRREKVEEEYRKSAAAREFARKPEQDHRLDPVMIQRRDSVGSIADNQDYSRRILKASVPIFDSDHGFFLQGAYQSLI